MRFTSALPLLALLTACSSTGSSESGATGSLNWWDQEFAGLESTDDAVVEGEPKSEAEPKEETFVEPEVVVEPEGVGEPEGGAEDNVVEGEAVAETLIEGLSVFDDWVDRLMKLAALYREELLTDGEFTAGKQRVFSDAQITVLSPAEVVVLPPVEVAKTPTPYTTPVEPAGGQFVTGQDSGDYIFGFQFVEADFVRSVSGYKSTGLRLRTLAEIQNGFYVGVEFLGTEGEDGGIATNGLGLDCGIHRPVGDQIEAYGSLGFVYSEVDDSSSTIDGNGELVLKGGVLYSPMDKMLLSADLTHVDGDLSLNVGARWFVDDQISLGVSTADDTAVLVGVRWSY